MVGRLGALRSPFDAGRLYCPALEAFVDTPNGPRRERCWAIVRYEDMLTGPAGELAPARSATRDAT